MNTMSTILSMKESELDIARRLEERGLIHLAKEVAHIHGVSLYALLGCGRDKTLARARRELYYVFRMRAFSLPEIGALLSRDHSTVLSGIRKYEAERTAPPEYRVRVAV